MSQLESYLQNLQRFGIRPGLERIQALLDRAGNPQLGYPHLLVGGTNGKGSTCEFIARCLSAGGRRVGLYTSPHVYNWHERLRILPGEGPRELFEGQISAPAMDALLQDGLPYIRSVAADLGQPTEFEVMTFLGLWHFARQKVDAAVIEVGLGGRWDATNTTSPLVSVVTHVALDHCDRLGSTVEAIAADKVHIARTGCPLVTAETDPSVLAVMAAHCGRIGARLVQVAPALATDFQEMNWQTARTAAGLFCASQGWELPETERPALQVPGRFETIAHAPRLILDAANNPDGAQHLARRLSAETGIQREKLVLVLGILADKDFAAMTALLAPLAGTVIATSSHSPRAAAAATIAHAAEASGARVEVIPEVKDAVVRARQLAGPEGTVLVTGSFTTISEVPRPR